MKTITTIPTDELRALHRAFSGRRTLAESIMLRGILHELFDRGELCLNLKHESFTDLEPLTSEKDDGISVEGRIMQALHACCPKEK